jgi:hypothetical protein
MHFYSEMAINLIQNHLNLLQIWYKEWGIKVNESQSIHCMFILRGRDFPPIYLCNSRLPTVQSVRYLVLHLNRRPTWET